MPIQDEIGKRARGTNGQSGVARLQALEIAATAMALAVCVSDRCEGVGDLTEAAEDLAYFPSCPGVLGYAFRHDLDLVAEELEQLRDFCAFRMGDAAVVEDELAAALNDFLGQRDCFSLVQSRRRVRDAGRSS